MMEEIFLSLLASTGDNRKAPGSFLFSLVNPSGLQPTKIPLITGKEGYAIYCDSSHGPIFGRSTAYREPDLMIPSLPNSEECSVRLNGSFRSSVRLVRMLPNF